MTTTKSNVIVAVHYTSSWDGYSVRYADGRQDTFSPPELLQEVGQAEFDRLSSLTSSQWTWGLWIKA